VRQRLGSSSSLIATGWDQAVIRRTALQILLSHIRALLTTNGHAFAEVCRRKNSRASVTITRQFQNTSNLFESFHFQTKMV
jgi:hypothetical protein